MVQFPETASREWRNAAYTAHARTRTRQRIERDTQVERAVERLRTNHEAKIKFQQELDAEQTPALVEGTLHDLLTTQAMTPPADLIEGMVKDTGVCLVLGPASSGKSTMAMQMLHSLTTGQNFLAQPAQKVAGDFGVLSYDMDYRMFGSILGAYPGIDAKRVSMVQAYNMGNPLNVPDFRRELASRWRKRGVEVVVVDSFSASFAGHNQNDAAEAMAHYRDLKTFALTEVGARVLVVIVHSTDNNPHRARGSTVHHDIADSIVGVSIEPKSGQRQLKMVKYRAAPGQNAAPTVITTAPDAVTHLVSLDSSAMTLAGIPLPPSVIAATAFPDTAEDASPGGVADPLAEGEEAKADPPEDYADWFPDLPDEEDREEVGTADED